MHWIITELGPSIHDYELARTRIGVGRLPRATKEAIVAAPDDERQKLVKRLAQNDEFKFEFQLKCDDGHLMYSGVCGDLDDADESEAFAPLDYAMADVGATIMEYRLKGSKERWRVL